eukprot:TRINITY_DN93647_c0_g1_i1.p1 TRINITY_DN93647_c0_g1~~TRINITY_DN93647_c0_g1_i1.p1  ORF type:complete len:193 (+),score=20.96 TRINITY_DN93647_c0_g1_i1:119-697(+)
MVNKHGALRPPPSVVAVTSACVIKRTPEAMLWILKLFLARKSSLVSSLAAGQRLALSSSTHVEVGTHTFVDSAGKQCDKPVWSDSDCFGPHDSRHLKTILQLGVESVLLAEMPPIVVRYLRIACSLAYFELPAPRFAPTKHVGNARKDDCVSQPCNFICWVFDATNRPSKQRLQCLDAASFRSYKACMMDYS